MATVEFKALAKTTGTCAMKGCTIQAEKIYTDGVLRILSCTQGHAQAVSTALSRPPAGMDMQTYRARLPQALAVFNARNPRTVAPVVEDDYDIDF